MTHELSKDCASCMDAYHPEYNWYIQPTYEKSREEGDTGEFVWGGAAVDAVKAFREKCGLVCPNNPANGTPEEEQLESKARRKYIFWTSMRNWYDDRGLEVSDYVHGQIASASEEVALNSINHK